METNTSISMDLKEKNLTVNWCGFHVSDLTFRVSILDFSKLLYWKNSAIHFFGGIIYSLKYSWVWPRVSSLWKAAWPSLCQLHSSLTKSFPLLGFMLRKGLRGGGCAAVFVKTLWPTTALSFGLWVLVWVGFQIFFGPLWTIHSLSPPIGNPSWSRVPKPREVLVPCLVTASAPGWSPFRTRPNVVCALRSEYRQGWPILKFFLGSITPSCFDSAGTPYIWYWQSLSFNVCMGCDFIKQWNKVIFIKLCHMYAVIATKHSFLWFPQTWRWQLFFGHLSGTSSEQARNEVLASSRKRIAQGPWSPCVVPVSMWTLLAVDLTCPPLKV